MVPQLKSDIDKIEMFKDVSQKASWTCK